MPRNDSRTNPIAAQRQEMMMGAIRWPIRVPKGRSVITDAAEYHVANCPGGGPGTGEERAAELVAAANRGHECEEKMEHLKAMSKEDRRVSKELCDVIGDIYQIVGGPNLDVDGDELAAVKKYKQNMEEMVHDLRGQLANAKAVNDTWSEIVALIPRTHELLLYFDGTFDVKDGSDDPVTCGEADELMEALRKLSDPRADTIATIRRALGEGTEERKVFEELLAERKEGA